MSKTKVPEVSLVFWIIKIAATMLGKTGGDSFSMTLSWGVADGHRIVSDAAGGVADLGEKFHPFFYWATIVPSTTAGTTMADFAARSASAAPAARPCCFDSLMAVLALWYRTQGSISVETVKTPKVEAFYWAAITLSQTLGTALGDWLADTGGFGYEGGALMFGAGLALLSAAYYWTGVSRVTLFWAFILTRPLGATVGDLLDRPIKHGGFDLGRPMASAVITAFIIVRILLLLQRAETHPGKTPRAT